MKTWTLAAAAALVSLAGGIARAQDKPAPETPRPMQTFLALERAPMGDFAVDPKDAALKKAIAMLPARLAELPGEIPEMTKDDADMIRMVAQTIARRQRFAVTFTPNYQAGGAMGYGVILNTPFDNKVDADALESRVLDEIRKEHPAFEAKESPRFPSLTEVVIPVAPLRFGSRSGRAGSSFDIIWGAVTDADAPFENLPKPTLKGTSIVHGVLDCRALTQIVGFMQTGINAGMKDSGQAPVQVGPELSQWGLIGQDAIQVAFEVAYTADDLTSRAVATNMGKMMGQLGIDQLSVKPADLKVIPADAVNASLSVITAKPLLKLVGNLRARFPEARQGLDEFTQRTGVNLEHDILAALGGQVAMYTSDSTGGGGFGSSIAMMQFTDRDRFVAAHGKLIGALKAMMSDDPDAAKFSKYIRVRTWKLEGADVNSLTFPGLPVPLELSYAFTDRWLVIGLTPQAVSVAVRQATGKGDAGLGTRKDLAAALPKGPLTAVSFSDTPRKMSDGYTLTCLIGSGVANAMRSPADLAREPGMVVPTFNELRAGARPTIAWSVYDAPSQTLTIESHADRSLLVNLAGTLDGSGLMSLVGQAAPVLGFMERRGGMNPRGFGALDLRDRIMLDARLLAGGPSQALVMQPWLTDAAAMIVR